MRAREAPEAQARQGRGPARGSPRAPGARARAAERGDGAASGRGEEGAGDGRRRRRRWRGGIGGQVKHRIGIDGMEEYGDLAHFVSVNNFP